MPGLNESVWSQQLLQDRVQKLQWWGWGCCKGQICPPSYKLVREQFPWM